MHIYIFRSHCRILGFSCFNVMDILDNEQKKAHQTQTSTLKKMAA